jgi:hypothetical protein
VGAKDHRISKITSAAITRKITPRYDYEVWPLDGADDDGVALTATATQCCSTNAATTATKFVQDG